MKKNVKRKIMGNAETKKKLRENARGEDGRNRKQLKQREARKGKKREQEHFVSKPAKIKPQLSQNDIQQPSWGSPLPQESSRRVKLMPKGAKMEPK